MAETELNVVTSAEAGILGSDVDRLPTLHTNARTDRELLEVLVEEPSRLVGRAHTVRVYARVGERFVVDTSRIHDVPLEISN